MSEPNGSGFADDILIGAAAIAAYVFNDPNQYRTIYHWRATSRIPIGRIGGRLVARKSELEQYLENETLGRWHHKKLPHSGWNGAPACAKTPGADPRPAEI